MDTGPSTLVRSIASTFIHLMTPGERVILMTAEFRSCGKTRRKQNKVSVKSSWEISVTALRNGGHTPEKCQVSSSVDQHKETSTGWEQHGSSLEKSVDFPVWMGAMVHNESLVDWVSDASVAFLSAEPVMTTRISLSHIITQCFSFPINQWSRLYPDC